VAALQAAGVTEDLGFVTEQLGMFSYSGLSAAQMQRLRQEFGVYGVDSGRICVAALNEGNLPTVAAAMAAVMRR
jgi:aromatic-amino-acid transaminase